MVKALSRQGAGRGSGELSYSRMSIGYLAPRVLVAWLLLDVGLRFLPIAWFGISPFFDALRFAGRYAPFKADVHYCISGASGQAASAANLTPTERYDQCFSTNDLGFRLNPAADGKSDVLVMAGDSFTYGSSLSDKDTLPAALTRNTGLNAFNAGRFHLDPDGLPELDWLLESLEGHPRIAIYVYLEHFNLNCGKARTGVAGYLDAAPNLAGWLRYARKLATSWRQVSPLEITARRMFTGIRENGLLPNTNQTQVHRLTLPNGQRILFRDYELLPARAPRSDATLRRTADCLAWWRDELAERGLATYVLLMPSRYTVYGPLLETGDALTRVKASEDYLDRLELELEKRGITPVNGLTVFREVVQQELRTGKLSFYREDNHWNARGVDRIAQALAQVIREDTH